jgi:hypothetical protein
MGDDKKPIDFKKAKLGLFKNKDQKSSHNNDVLRSISRVPPPPPQKPKKPDVKVLSNLEAIRKQRDEDLKEMDMIRRRLESEEYVSRVLQIAQDVYVRSQPQLVSDEQERLALAESAIQAGQAYYKIAKEFKEYVAMEDFIHGVMSEEKNNKK